MIQHKNNQIINLCRNAINLLATKSTMIEISYKIDYKKNSETHI